MTDLICLVIAIMIILGGAVWHRWDTGYWPWELEDQ